MSIAMVETASVFEIQPLVNSFRTMREWVRPGSRDHFGTYLEWAESRSLRERETLVGKVCEKVASGDLPPQSLMVFISGDAHPAIIEQALASYLVHRPCYLNDEFGGVREVLELLSGGSAENPGALLSALVGLGDRRVNAVARVVRRSLCEEDIRQFSRNVPRQMQAAHIEFCVEWLLQCYGDGESRLTLASLTCALMLVVLNDVTGVVADREAGIGTTIRGDERLISFNDYAPDIINRLQAVMTGEAIDYEINKVISLWQGHAMKLAA